MVLSSPFTVPAWQALKGEGKGEGEGEKRERGARGRERLL